MLNWINIVTKFENAFKETFTADRKAHFDNLPHEFHIVDGAKIQWCNLLLLDAIIFIIKNDSFSHSIRRAFNQSLVLYQCIMQEFQTVDPRSYDVITEEKKMMIELGREQNSEVANDQTSFYLLIDDPNWQSMAHLEAYLISETPASKAKLKFPVVVKLLTSHETFSIFGFDLQAILRAVVFKIMFRFNPGKAKPIIVTKKALSASKIVTKKKPSITEALQEYRQQQKAASGQMQEAISGQDYPVSPTTDEFLFDGLSDCLLGCDEDDNRRIITHSDTTSTTESSQITSPIGTQGTLTPPSPSRRKRCALSVDLSIPPCEETNSNNYNSISNINISNIAGAGRAKGPLERIKQQTKQTKQRLFSPKCYSDAVAAIKAQAGDAVGAPAGKPPVPVITTPYIISDASVPVEDIAIMSPAHTLGSTVGSTSSEATDNVSTVDGGDDLVGMTFDQADFDLLLADFEDGDGMMFAGKQVSDNHDVRQQGQQQGRKHALSMPADVNEYLSFGSSCSLSGQNTEDRVAGTVMNSINNQNECRENQQEASDSLFAQGAEEESMFEWLYPLMMDD